MIDNNIAAIIVTFNKKHLLIDAVQGVLGQKILPNALFIIDNNSDDGTYQMLLENEFINEVDITEEKEVKISTKNYHKENDKIVIHYVKKNKNEGGAGGFYEGMKLAYDLKYDWLWLMDDDGVPERDCLKYLIQYKTEDSVIGPLVIDIATKKTASFLYNDKGDLADVAELETSKVLYNVLNPFNGTLISRNIITKIGFVKKEMFIWGDEQEYQSRVLANGFVIKTITEAKHYHPVNKKKILFKSKTLRFTIYEIPSPKFYFIFFRNYIYLAHKYPNRKILSLNISIIRWLYEVLLNSFYHLIIGDYTKFKLGLFAIVKGLKSDFSLDIFTNDSLLRS